eukprot:8564588-Heterocapsa_arctica.AAC.1
MAGATGSEDGRVWAAIGSADRLPRHEQRRLPAGCRRVRIEGCVSLPTRESDAGYCRFSSPAPAHLASVALARR